MRVIMKKPKITMLTAGTVMLCLSLLFAGCGPSNTENTPPADSTPTTSTPASGEPSTTTQPSSEEPESAEPSGDSLADILTLATGIESVSFDMEITSTEAASMTTKLWLKGLKMKTESSMEGQTVINYINQETRTMYTYIPEQNTAIMMTYD